MNKTVPKKMKMGYELRINQTGVRGEENWKRVGTLFGSSQEASEYRARKYPNVQKYTIMGVKVSAFPKVRERYMFVTEKSEKKGGTHNAPKQS